MSLPAGSSGNEESVVKRELFAGRTTPTAMCRVVGGDSGGGEAV
jgi:hypothetical protein